MGIRHRRCRLYPFLILLIIGWSTWPFPLPGITANTLKFAQAVILTDKDYNEFVQEVVEEDAWHHDQTEGETPNSEEEFKRRKIEEELLRQQKQEQQQQQQQEARAEQLRHQAAEEAFVREMESLSAEQQKALRKKRRQDSRIVQRILQAWERQDYYTVLGLRWFFPEGITLIRGRGFVEDASSSRQEKTKFSLKEAIWHLKWPPLVIMRTSQRKIQQANRKRAMQVHPDKNRDPRSDQAFVAIQDAFAVLSDPVRRRNYEAQRRLDRIAIRQAWKKRYHQFIDATLRPTWTVFRRFVSPFAVPFFIIAALVF
jgi:hypothetical protein